MPLCEYRTEWYVRRKKPNSTMAVMKQINSSLSAPGVSFSDQHRLGSEFHAPLFEVKSIHGLNQLIGYAKFINRSYGEVLYRGENKLHEALMPSLLRGKTNCTKSFTKLNCLISEIKESKRFKNLLKLEGMSPEESSLIIEGMLQHYGVPTRYIDLVDNHWIALWMCSNAITNFARIKHYQRYACRLDNHYDLMSNEDLTESFPTHPTLKNSRCTPSDKNESHDRYGYLLLVCLPYGASRNPSNGITLSKEIARIDLRQAIPSIFLRPHAQHGLVAKKHGRDEGDPSFYDMATQVIGIIKIRIDRICSWIGSGSLLTQDNLFPAPAYDCGYDALLDCEDLFVKYGFSIARYV